MTLDYRKNFMFDVIVNNIDIKKYRWVDLELKYGYPPTDPDKGVKPGDRIRKHYTWYISKGIHIGEWKPHNSINELVQEEICYDNDEYDIEEELVVSSQNDIPPGGKLVKVWGKPGNLSYSYVFNHDKVDFREELLNEFKKYVPQKINIITPSKTYGNYTYLISLPDMHFGKSSIEETVDLFRWAIKELIERVDRKKLKHIVIPIGNDLFHTEGKSQSTTKGTKMFDYADWKECFNVVWKVLISEIDNLTSICPITIPVVLGNHDEERNYYLGCLLEAYYQNNSYVTIMNDQDPRKYIHFGKVLLGFDHGELKANEYPLIMATEKPIEFSKSNTKIMLCGHLHSQQNYEFRGIHVRYMPSLCSLDDWHKKMGYLAQRAGQAYKFDDNGLIGYEEVRVE